MERLSEIKKSLEQPKQIEKRYRLSGYSEKRQFKQDIAKLYADEPSNPLISAWYWRLFYSQDKSIYKRNKKIEILWILLLTAISGFIIRIGFLSMFNFEHYLIANMGFFFFPFLWIYFLRFTEIDWKWIIIGLVFTVSSVLYVNTIPARNSQSFYIAGLYLPFLLWFIWLIIYRGKKWRSTQGRIDFLKFNGELVIIMSIILLGGMVLTGLISLLFSAIGIDLTQFLREWVMVYGIAAVPIVSASIVRKRMNNEQFFAPLLAKIFSPLFAIVLFIFMFFMIGSGGNPYQNREILIIFNGVMILILAIIVFVITEKDHEESVKLQDYLNIGLIGVTVIIDMITLSAMVYRIGNFGLTPNKFMTTGANILIVVHMIGLFLLYIRYIMKKGPLEDVKQWLVKYLSIYAIWAFFCVFILPLLFRFG